jgi:hypothetical protein
MLATLWKIVYTCVNSRLKPFPFKGNAMGLSTHVLDTMHGCPAAGMQVALYTTDGAQATLVKRLTLNSMIQDPTMASERLSYRLHALVEPGRAAVATAVAAPEP